MRIVHTCLRYPPATGGAERYVQELVTRTRNKEAQRDVRVLTSRLKTHGPLSELDPGALLVDLPHVQRLHHATTPLISYPRLQALNYYLGHHRPDILHAYSFWYQPADVAARYAKRHRLPFIFHPIYYENEIRQKPVWQLYKHTIGRATFAAADIVAVISPYEQTLIEKANFPIKRFELLPPGIDTATLKTPRANPFTAKGISGPTLLTVSRLSHGKGLHELIEILPTLLKGHPDLTLVVIGEDFGAQTDLANQAKNLGIQKHIHFWGKVDDTTLIAAYQHTDLVVHPSYYEAFGITLAESLACGTPVVARNTSAIPYVAPHNTAGLLFTNTTELTAHVKTLLDNKQLRMRLGQSGQQHVQQFDWQHTIKKLVKLYAELNQ